MTGVAEGQPLPRRFNRMLKKEVLRNLVPSAEADSSSSTSHPSAHAGLTNHTAAAVLVVFLPLHHLVRELLSGLKRLSTIADNISFASSSSNSSFFIDNFFL
jgi:hypothetical protein